MPTPSEAVPTRLDRLLQTSPWRVQRYAELSTPNQLAIAQYLAVEGAAWAQDEPQPVHGQSAPYKVLEEALPKLVRQYGEHPFGVLSISVPVLQAAIMADKEIAEDWPNWEAYHQWYCLPTSGGVPKHTAHDRWPVLLSNDPTETVLDGWHRLHCYVLQGAQHVPALFFRKRTT